MSTGTRRQIIAGLHTSLPRVSVHDLPGGLTYGAGVAFDAAPAGRAIIVSIYPPLFGG